MLSRHLLFDLSRFDDWKTRMLAYLSALHDEMAEVIKTGPVKIVMVNTAAEQTKDTPKYVPKPREEWTSDDRKRNNLDNIAKDILFRAIDETIFPKVRKCTTAKEVWDTLMLIGEGDEQEKENKLTVAMKKFEDFKMKPGESIDSMESRFMKLSIEISDLEKEIPQKEQNLKILRGLTKEWEMKVITMRDHRDLKNTTTDQLFRDLKAFEFEMFPRDEDVVDRRNVALVAEQPSTSSRSDPKPTNILSDEQFALFMRKFRKYMKKTPESNTSSPSSSRRKNERFTSKRTEEENQGLCYNCRRPGHFKAECPYPMVSKYQGQEGRDSRRKEESREKPAQGGFKGETKNHPRRKALVAEELEKAIEESETSSSSDSSSSSEDERGLICLYTTEEEDQCLMAINNEVTSTSTSRCSISTSQCSSFRSDEDPFETMELLRRNLEIANSTHAKTLEENSRLIAEREILKNVSKENSELTLKVSNLEAEIIQLKEECKAREVKELNLKEVIASYTNSSKAMEKMVNDHRPTNDRTGLGFRQNNLSKDKQTTGLGTSNNGGSQPKPNKGHKGPTEKTRVAIHKPSLYTRNGKYRKATKNGRVNNIERSSGYLSQGHSKYKKSYIPYNAPQGKYGRSEIQKFRISRMEAGRHFPSSDDWSEEQEPWDKLQFLRYHMTKQAMKGMVRKPEVKPQPKLIYAPKRPRVFASIPYDYQTYNGYIAPRPGVMGPRYKWMPKLTNQSGPKVWVPKSA